jgi:hypothetical protein
MAYVKLKLVTLINIYIFDVELHLFSRYDRGLAEKTVTSHVTLRTTDVTAIREAYTRCARSKLPLP